jgi:hypothetical protein
MPALKRTTSKTNRFVVMASSASVATTATAPRSTLRVTPMREATKGVRSAPTT